MYVYLFLTFRDNFYVFLYFITVTAERQRLQLQPETQREPKCYGTQVFAWWDLGTGILSPQRMCCPQTVLGAQSCEEAFATRNKVQIIIQILNL
jgi:hypothetical protein